MSHTAQQQRPPARPSSSRGNPATSDIVRSVLLLAVVLLVVWWVAGLFRNDTVIEQPAIDYRAVAEQAALASDYPLLVPESLPDGWRVTQADWDPADEHWHLGLLTEADAYVGVEQQSGTATADLVERYAPGAERGGETAADGTSWETFVDAEKERTALVSENGAVTTMVLGSASADELAAFLGTLEPVTRP